MPQSSKHMDINDNHFVITALKASDEKVFEAVYRHYFRSLCGFCSQYVSEQEEIEEIVQDTLVWLWENRSSLVEELTLRPSSLQLLKIKRSTEYLILKSGEEYTR